VFFFPFRRESRDELFTFFGAALWLLSASWALLALFNLDEARPLVYAIRLVAFGCIIVAIVRKNSGR
jgi:hypothetical protein